VLLSWIELIYFYLITGYKISECGFFKMEKTKMEKEFVERELSQLMEITLKLEDELNSIGNE
jgi:uncharacterized phage-like protein YoqJ